MAHARQSIRDAAVTALTRLTTTGTACYSGRVNPYETLPCLSVYTLSESVEGGELGTKQMRMLTLRVEARARAASDLDDTLDTITAEVETALMADRTLGGTAKTLELAQTEIELSGDAEQPVGLAVLDFAVLYRIDGTDPTTTIS